jgi:hypothetical protein
MSDQLANLLSELQHKNIAARRMAAERLARLGAVAASAADKLVLACADDDEQTREWVVAALEELPAPATESASRLAELLPHDNTDVAYWAATLLGRMERQAAVAVDKLAQALQSRSEIVVRQRIAWALGKIGMATDAAIAQLQQAAASSDVKLARIAAQSLAALQR